MNPGPPNYKSCALPLDHARPQGEFDKSILRDSLRVVSDALKHEQRWSPTQTFFSLVTGFSSIRLHDEPKDHQRWRPTLREMSRRTGRAGQVPGTKIRASHAG